MIWRQETAAPANFPLPASARWRPWQRRCFRFESQAQRLATGASRALAARLGSSAGHRVVVAVSRAPPVVSALMKVRSTASHGVGAQALPLSGEYLVGWLSGPRTWTFACGWVGTPSLSRQSVWNSGLPCPNARQ
jgi:hypothetical protein